MAEIEATTNLIDPDGDVFLEFTNSDGSKSQLLVSSKVLTLASPVFRIMFNSQFKESMSNRSTFQKQSIPLPDDDLEAFTVLCNILHHRNFEVPKELTIDSLENLGVICDKYDCTRVLEIWSTIWLKPWIASHRSVNLNKLLLIAFLLNNPYAFSRFSWEIISAHSGQFMVLPGVSDHPLVRYDILGKSKKPPQETSKLNSVGEFRVRKTEMMLELAKLIESPIACVLGKMKASPCSNVSQCVASCLYNLHCRDLWPISGVLQRGTIFRALGQIDSFPIATPEVKCSYGCNSCSNGIPNARETLFDGKKKFLDTKIGACLDCVKTEEESLQKGECRIKHQCERKCKKF